MILLFFFQMYYFFIQRPSRKNFILFLLFFSFRHSKKMSCQNNKNQQFRPMMSAVDTAQTGSNPVYRYIPPLTDPVMIPDCAYRSNNDAMYSAIARSSNCHPRYTPRQTVFVCRRLLNRGPTPCERPGFVNYADPLVFAPGKTTLVNRQFTTPMQLPYWHGFSF